MSDQGEPLDCETFTSEDGAGLFVMATLNEDAPIINQDVANILGLAD